MLILLIARSEKHGSNLAVWNKEERRRPSFEIYLEGIIIRDFYPFFIHFLCKSGQNDTF